ncbi:MAG: hypothetical protein LBE20_02620, partial [Deltaproteobacteria bacterium]|nr:hypothetical protein [Deltaproteobacteria bacterium]
MNILRQIHKYVVITAVFLFCFLAVEKTFAQQNEEKIIPYQERLKQQEKQIKQIDSKKDDKLKGLDKLIEKVKNSTTVKQIHDWVNRSTGDSSKDYKADSVTARINVRKNGVKSGGGDPRGEASEDFKDGAESDAFQDIQDRKTFYDCFEPRIIEKRCDYCNPKIVHPDYQNCLPILNTGERWEYWWPEFEIEINNFGISAFKANKRSDLSHDALVKACTASILSGVPEYVRTIINNKQMGQELAGNSGNEIVQRYEKEVKEVSEKINKLCGGTGLGASIPEGET